MQLSFKEINVSGLTSRIICTPMNNTNYSPCTYTTPPPPPPPPPQNSIDAVISGSLSGKRLYRNRCVLHVSSAQKSIWNFICIVNSPLNAKSRLGHKTFQHIHSFIAFASLVYARSECESGPYGETVLTSLRHRDTDRG